MGEPRQAAGLVVVINAAGARCCAAAEASFVASAHGVTVRQLDQKPLARRDWLEQVRSALTTADCVVVVAARDRWLAEKVASLASVPVVAVPAGVRGGSPVSGLLVLLAMLGSPAPGTAVCDIDNGFGAAVLAAKIARRAGAS